MLILPLHTITCFLLVCVLTESSELWGVWPDHGRTGEADRCSQHPAQRDWIVQPSALCQLCRQQGERKHTHMMQHSVFTQQLIQTVNVLLNPIKTHFYLLSCLLGELYSHEETVQQSTGELCSCNGTSLSLIMKSLDFTRKHLGFVVSLSYKKLQQN